MYAPSWDYSQETQTMGFFNLKSVDFEIFVMSAWKELKEGIKIPLVSTIEETQSRLEPLLVKTPVWEWHGVEKHSLFGSNNTRSQIFLKLELLQYTGSFKPRGVLCVMEQLSSSQLENGVTCVSAGNHALALAYAAKQFGTTAHVVMPRTVSKIRVEKCQAFGAKISLVEDIHAGFEMVRQIEIEEQRYFVHPFEGSFTALGTATLGLEFLQQIPSLDAIFVPIGGGGLCAGISLAIKQLKPTCRIIGVEPEGADTMRRSFQSGMPEKIEKVDTIADSLAAPYAMPYSFNVCQAFVDDIVTISDNQMQQAMRVLFNSAKIAVEPAGAAATAAIISGFSESLLGKHVGIIVCGANIDVSTFSSLVL